MKKRETILLGSLLALAVAGQAQSTPYDGLDNNLANLYRLSNAQSFSISPENPTGEKGQGGMASEGTGANAARELG